MYSYRPASHLRTPPAAMKKTIERWRSVWRSSPWLHWGVVFAIPMLYFVINKLVALPVLLTMYAAPDERTAGTRVSGMLLAMLEDLTVTTLLVALLLLLKIAAGFISSHRFPWAEHARLATALHVVGWLVYAVVVLALVVAAFAAFAADMVLILAREMRFTMDFIVAYKREQEQAEALTVDPREMALATNIIAVTTVVAVLYTLIYVACVDLTLAWRRRRSPEQSSDDGNIDSLVSSASLEAGKRNPTDSDEPTCASVSSPSELGHTSNEVEYRDAITPRLASATPPSSSTNGKNLWKRLPTPVLFAVVAAGLCIGLVYATYGIAQSVNGIVSAIGLNATLNEVIGSVFRLNFLRSVEGSGSVTKRGTVFTGTTEIAWAEQFIHTDTEDYELFENEALYRRTTGFKGPLAFDVAVNDTNPPNVLVLAVESLRYMDSRYLVDNLTIGEVYRKHNLTLTPQWDRWAKQGIAFSNMWSSWQTSRALEAILFGQINYDSVTDSGTTTGRVDTELVGMPQFFTQKGYETVFTTGCTLWYDQWDTFLPSHGFETVLGGPEFRAIAERDYHIAPGDWEGDARRWFYWGVHDDVGLRILGDIMVNKTKDQQQRVEKGNAKHPFFLNHFTISSHTPFDEEPAWFHDADVPDFSPLCEGYEGECDLIKRYARMRYFTDMELGKFLDRMDAEGVLKDTIVVMVGDHGQAPELGTAKPYEYQTAVTRVAGAIVAQGRLSEDAVGTIMDDAVQHYDLLNTLADIVGVPADGFLQTSVGRSLKRKVEFGSRGVWTNNPFKKLSVVRGNERFVYDRRSNEVGLFDTLEDPLETNDLLPDRSSEERKSWDVVRNAGRALNAYFTDRLDAKCIAKATCG